MSLREVELHFRFAGGIETKADPKSVPATKLLVLENGVFGRAISIKKRNGYEAYAKTIDGSIDLTSDGIRLGVRDGELLQFSRTRCYSKHTGTDKWSDVGPVLSVPAVERPLSRTGTQQLQPDQASLDGVTVAAWEDSRGGVWWSVIDTDSGRNFRVPQQADADGQSPRCVPCGTNLHIYYVVPSDRALMVIVVDPQNPALAVAPVTVTEDVDSTFPFYDIVPTQRAERPAIAAWREHATDRMRIGYITGSGSLGGPLTGHPDPIEYPVSGDLGVDDQSPIGIAFLDVDGGGLDQIAVAFVQDTSGFAMIGNVTGGDFPGGAEIGVGEASYSLFSIGFATRVSLAITPTSRHVWSAWEVPDGEPSNTSILIGEASIDAGTNGGAGSVRSVGLASRMFTFGDEAFVVTVHDTTFFNTYVTLCISDDTLNEEFVAIGRHAPGSATGLPLRRHLPSVHLVGDVAMVALPVRDRLISENSDRFRETGLKMISMDFASDSSHQTVQLGRGLYMGGGCMQHYDGRIWTEQGFHFGPELIDLTPASGGSMTSSTTYKYQAWYEWTDAQGEVHRGPTSVGQLVTMGGSDTQVTLDLPTLRVTRKPNVRIMVARSLAALTGDTARMFRATSLDPNTEGDANGYMPNDIAVDSITFVDQMSDDDLLLQDEIYTDGGILSNDPVATSGTIARSKSRLFALDAADGNVLRFTQPIEDGYGAEFAPELFHRCDPQGGDITAIAVQDDRVLLFKRDAVFSFAGDGPLQNGDSSTQGFTEPSQLTSDIGCIEPASVTLIPQGCMFRSAKGFQLLMGASLAREQHDGFGAAQYIGSPVEAFNGQSVRRGTVMPDRTQVAFLTNSGSTLLYDYLFSQWSTFTNHEGQDSAVVSGVYHYLRNDGRVFRETIGEYSDAGQRIRLRIETAMIHMQEQLQGFHKFFEMFLLGTWLSPHQLGISYRTDYSPQWGSPVWLDATGSDSSAGWITGEGAATIGVDPIVGTGFGEGGFGEGPFGGTVPDLYEWRLDLYEKGSAIQFRIEDFEAVGFRGAAFELTELMLTGGVERNAPKPWSAARSM